MSSFIASARRPTTNRSSTFVATIVKGGSMGAVSGFWQARLAKLTFISVRSVR